MHELLLIIARQRQSDLRREAEEARLLAAARRSARPPAPAGRSLIRLANQLIDALLYRITTRTPRGGQR